MKLMMFYSAKSYDHHEVFLDSGGINQIVNSVSSFASIQIKILYSHADIQLKETLY